MHVPNHLAVKNSKSEAFIGTLSELQIKYIECDLREKKGKITSKHMEQ